MPADQQQKLGLIDRAETALEPALNAKPTAPPTDAEIITALNQTATRLQQAATSASDKTGPGRPCRAASRHRSEPARRGRCGQTGASATGLCGTVAVALTNLHDLLKAEPVTLETLPDPLIRDWVAPNAEARIELLPKGDPNDNETLRKFARAVLAVAPQAIGGPISILESGRTIVRAFIEAGLLAIAAIALLLIVVLAACR